MIDLRDELLQYLPNLFLYLFHVVFLRCLGKFRLRDLNLLGIFSLLFSIMLAEQILEELEPALLRLGCVIFVQLDFFSGYTPDLIEGEILQ